ncbi:type III-A CRISPR-associated RAMP protein Csm5 [Thermodesulfovibrio sp. Kuro-1]|uniref:type III-A CRISPR-associated RAMP protein Csm5 n=1 Tax=Thermodesulfovibrio sp. Kuro-1 TaxID=2580394 RepID=UPI001142AB6D|nr:type III-A CRISPR-associated RAMP protein Csm5 [Thermodesulfovibrio sp. Kuro-1]
MALFEKAEVKIVTKSPVHIGGVEQKKTRFEFIIHDNYLYPISEDRLAEFLSKKNLIFDYCAQLENKAHLFNLADFLKSKAFILNESLLLKLSSDKRIYLNHNASLMQDYRPYIRDGFGIPYIPGTSIKGVIRTAILYNLLKELKESSYEDFEVNFERRIVEDIEQKKSKRDFSAWLNKEYFEGFKLLGKEKSPHTDWLKMLKISDAYPDGEIQTSIIPINILKKEESWKYKEEYSGKKTTIWTECIPENVTFRFEVLWERSFLSEFKKQHYRFKMPENLNATFECINRWAQDLINFEKEFLATNAMKKWYENNVCNFRIGFGSGMISTTILMLLSEPLRKKIRNYAGLDRGETIAPKSRRVFQRDSLLTPLGWCLITVDGTRH